MGGNFDVHAIERLVAGHSAQVDILHADHVAGVDALNASDHAALARKRNLEHAGSARGLVAPRQIAAMGGQGAFPAEDEPIFIKYMASNIGYTFNRTFQYVV